MFTVPDELEKSGPIYEQLHEGVALLYLNRPTQGNSLTFAMREKIIELINQYEGESAIKAVVIAAAGNRAFCGGADLMDLAASPASLFAQYADVTNKIESFSKPTVAAVGGYCAGGGFELVLACDFCLVGPFAKFAFPELSIGAIPGSGGTQRLTRYLGIPRAKQVILGGLHIDAEKAIDWGIACQIAEGNLVNAAVELALKLAGNTPKAYKTAKTLIQLAPELSMAEGTELEGSSMSVIANTPEFTKAILELDNAIKAKNKK